MQTEKTVISKLFQEKNKPDRKKGEDSGSENHHQQKEQQNEKTTKELHFDRTSRSYCNYRHSGGYPAPCSQLSPRTRQKCQLFIKSETVRQCVGTLSR